MKPLTFLLFTFIILFTGCGKSTIDSPNAPEGLLHWNVSKVEGPNSGFVNQSVILDVYCPTSSGCDYISKLVADRSGKTISIRAYGNTLINSPCTMAATPKIVKFEFTPDEKGQFILKFISRDNSVIIHNLTIR